MAWKKGSKVLLRDEDVRRWYEDLLRGSENTAEEWLRILARFCREVGITPEDVLTAQLEDASRKGFLNTFRDYVQKKRDAGRLPGYLQNFSKVLNSFLEFHGFRHLPRVRVGNTVATPTLRGETVPTKERLREWFLRASSRGRVVMSLMAFSGLRPGVIGTRHGTDGLRLGDLPDLRVEDRSVEVLRSPVLVKVRPELSKTSYAYVSYLPEEGITYLTAYLQGRLEGGEKIDPDSPVVRVKAGFEVMGKRKGSPSYGLPFITSFNVTKDVRAAMGNHEARPYVLRRYCEDSLMLAERRANVSRDFRLFWMGRKGDISHHYVLHKGLSPDLIEEMREHYGKAQPYLQTVGPAPIDDRGIPTVSMDDLAELFIQEPMKLRDLADAIERKGSPPPDLRKSAGQRG